jgi:hypothetical protein
MKNRNRKTFLYEAIAALSPLDKWSHQCHAASVALVRAGVGDRVARGMCPGVGGQHSWVVMGENVYDREALIIDPTLWSYRDDVTGIYVGTAAEYGHRPHGAGSIWDWGRPVRQGGPVISLTPTFELSRSAERFLEMLGPLDMRGWQTLANAPVEDWPASEIYAAMDDTPDLSALVPIDRLGMLTDRNPGGLYMRRMK